MAKDAQINISVATDRPFFFAMSQAEQESFDNALSDVICWLSGFQAAGGTYSPGSLESLRNLRLKIQPATSKESNAVKLTGPHMREIIMKVLNHSLTGGASYELAKQIAEELIRERNKWL